ncbi:Increased recombination centers protein 22 [Grifola frondosa]|uniref:Increased recombination centers protein 22 n=1 Tax=Grifola frondosa TaxID=5627 RepID=A0A1C7M8M9_GRIFR|nr:Increased recombination centers protein 22 [Grifola frondosa]
MRLHTFIGYIIGSIALFQLNLASPVEEASDEPLILAVASFSEENAFGHVVNGESNRIYLTVENKSDRNVTLVNIAGAFHHPETNALVKNTSALTYNLPLLEGASLQLPYMFYSEFKPGDLRLSIWLEHNDDGNTYRVMAYDSIVTIVEPPVSIFDFKLVSTYFVVGLLLSGLGYYAYLTFVPQPKKRKGRTAPQVSAPVGTVTATGAGGYQEEWIPEHHLKKTKKAKSGAATSGDETSGAEMSPSEGRKRKGKK